MSEIKSPTPPAGPQSSQARRERRERLSVEIPESLDKALRVYAAGRRTSIRDITVAALRSYLHPHSDENRDAFIARRLQRNDAKLRVLLNQTRLNGIALGAFVQIMVGLLPEPSTKEEQREYREKSERRFPRYVEMVAQALANGGDHLYARLPKEFVAEASDFVGDGTTSAPSPPTPNPGKAAS